MVLRYTVCDSELPNSGKFSYISFLQGFQHDLILGLPYPGNFPHPINIPILPKLQYESMHNI